MLKMQRGDDSNLDDVVVKESAAQKILKVDRVPDIPERSLKHKPLGATA